jgi:hypothetical protein
VDWADLVTLDLGQFDAPGGKEALAAQLFDAVNRIGENAKSQHRGDDASIYRSTRFIPR